MVQTVSGGEVAKAGGSVLGLASLPLLPGHQPCEVLSPTEPVAVAPQPAVARISPHEGTGLQGFNIFFFPYPKRGEACLMTERGCVII